MFRCSSVIDVSSEWRTFSDKDGTGVDMCRVGAAEDASMEGRDLATYVGRATGSAGFDENGKPIYRNRFVVCFFSISLAMKPMLFYFNSLRNRRLTKLAVWPTGK